RRQISHRHPAGGCIIDGVRDDAEIFVAHRDPLAVGAVFSDTVRAGEHDPLPSIKGAVARGYPPDRMVWSSGVMPAAVIRTSTLPSARRGLGTSTSFSPPYPVNDSARIALIMISPFLPFATADVSPRCHGNDRSA